MRFYGISISHVLKCFLSNWLRLRIILYVKYKILKTTREKAPSFVQNNNYLKKSMRESPLSRGTPFSTPQIAPCIDCHISFCHSKQRDKLNLKFKFTYTNGSETVGMGWPDIAQNMIISKVHCKIILWVLVMETTTFFS